MAALDHAVSEIYDNPQRWSRHLHGTRKFLLRHFPYSIIYRVTDVAIQVVPWPTDDAVLVIGKQGGSKTNRSVSLDRTAESSLIQESKILPIALPLTLHPSPNYFIRSNQHVGRNRQADLLGCLQIDHELKLHRLLDREISRLGTLENFVDVSGCATVALIIVS